MGARRARRGHVYRRRTKSGGWSAWHAVIDLDRDTDGRRQQRSRSFPTRAAAYQWLAGIQATGAADGPTLGQWLAGWAQSVGDLRASTRRSYVGHIANFLVPLLGDLRLSKLAAADVEALHEMLAAAGVSTELARRIHATLSSALSDAERDGLISANPCLRVRVPRGERRTPAVWSAAQAARFLAATTGDGHAGLWRVALLLGLRRGELCGLRWTDVDLDAATLTARTSRVLVGDQVVEGPPKSARGRRVLPLDARSVEILKREWARQTRQALDKRWGPMEYAFTDETGRPVHPAWVSRRFGELCERLELPRIRFHDLRHYYASRLIRFGESVKTVQNRLGPCQRLGDARHLLAPVAGCRRQNARGGRRITLRTGCDRRATDIGLSRGIMPDQRGIWWRVGL